MKSTKQKLTTAASELLDSGGQEAVTLRAVADKVRVSHNAPYRHFRDRSALLSGVAEDDFGQLSSAFQLAFTEEPSGREALDRAIGAFVGYGINHPARYRLLFSDPTLEPSPALKKAAFAPFEAFLAIILRCQGEGSLPESEPAELAGLLYASLHGAIDLEIGGRTGESKGLKSISATIALLLRLLRT